MLKYYFFLPLLLICSLQLLFGQPPANDGTDGYTNNCSVTVDATQWGFSSVESYWNDTGHGECFSTDWQIIFYYPDGDFHIVNSENYYNLNPTYGPQDFGPNSNFGCCIYSNGPGIDYDPDCECEWVYERSSNTVTLDCPCLPGDPDQ